MKTNKTFFVALVAFISAAVSSVLLGSVNFSIFEIFQTITTGENSSIESILLYVRIPRTLACLLSGGALAASGVLIQEVLGNKLASPGIIGVNAGAGLAVTVCFSLNVTSALFLSGAAFAGAVIASFCIVFIARYTGMHRSDLILIGLGINGIFNAITETIKSVNVNASSMSSDFMVGGFTSVVSSRLLPASIIVIISLIIAWIFINDLDVLSLGEDTAKSLGMNTSFVRTAFLLMASALAGTAVSIAGMLSFVGLIIPHIVKSLGENESRSILPISVLLGSSFVTICDVLSRVLFAPYEIPAGILISALGSPFLIYLLLKSKKGRVK